jgi:hypothetical protein
MKVPVSLIEAIRKARQQMAAGEQERAKAFIDEALVIMDAVLYAKSGNGWPKAKLRAESLFKQTVHRGTHHPKHRQDKMFVVSSYLLSTWLLSRYAFLDGSPRVHS